MMRLFAITLALFLGTGLGAQTTDLRKLETEYSAKIWRAVGRIDLAGGRARCSGTLIAPDLVLTAAHCLYRPGTATLFRPSEIVFHAGLRQGKAVTSRRVSAASAHKAFDPTGDLTFENVRYDVGLIRLEEPISSYDIPSFKLYDGDVSPGPVSVVSYGQGRSETQSHQKECQLTTRVEDVLMFDCDAVPGTSGAPVFSHLNGRGQILAVVSGGVASEGSRRSVGMVLPQRVNEVKRQMRIQVRGPVAKVRRLTVGARSGGAKFVRSN